MLVKNMSSEVVSMKDLNVVYDATELLKIMDKINYMIIGMKEVMITIVEAFSKRHKLKCSRD